MNDTFASKLAHTGFKSNGKLAYMCYISGRWCMMSSASDAYTLKIQKRQQVGQSTLSWATAFFFKSEENKFFSTYAYRFIYKSDLLNPNFVENFLYFILFFLRSYSFDEQSEFLILQFY